MGLDNIPHPHPCEKTGAAVKDKDGKIDCLKVIENGGCTFNTSKHPTGILGSFCWFRGGALARELDAIGYPDTGFLYETLTPKALKAKADELESFLERFKQAHETDNETVTGAGWNGILTTQGIQYQHHSNYDEIIETINHGIEWFRRIAEYDCEVKAWY